MHELTKRKTRIKGKGFFYLTGRCTDNFYVFYSPNLDLYAGEEISLAIASLYMKILGIWIWGLITDALNVLHGTDLHRFFEGLIT